jgi:hypothetical protein
MGDLGLPRQPISFPDIPEVTRGAHRKGGEIPSGLDIPIGRQASAGQATRCNRIQLPQYKNYIPFFEDHKLQHIRIFLCMGVLFGYIKLDPFVILKRILEKENISKVIYLVMWISPSVIIYKKTPWLWSKSELCRPSDRRLLAK